MWQWLFIIETLILGTDHCLTYIWWHVSEISSTPVFRCHSSLHHNAIKTYLMSWIHIRNGGIAPRILNLGSVATLLFDDSSYQRLASSLLEQHWPANMCRAKRFTRCFLCKFCHTTKKSWLLFDVYSDSLRFRPLHFRSMLQLATGLGIFKSRCVISYLIHAIYQDFLYAVFMKTGYLYTLSIFRLVATSGSNPAPFQCYLSLWQLEELSRTNFRKVCNLYQIYLRDKRHLGIAMFAVVTN